MFKNKDKNENRVEIPQNDGNLSDEEKVSQEEGQPEVELDDADKLTKDLLEGKIN